MLMCMHSNKYVVFLSDWACERVCLQSEYVRISVCVCVCVPSNSS